MKKVPLILLMSLAMASGVYAQGASGGITMSTDPARAVAVERHAQEIKARQAQQTQAKPKTKASTAPKAKTHAAQAKPKTKASSATTAKPATKQSHSTAKPVAKK